MPLRLSYGQALLRSPTGPAPLPGQQPTTSNDTASCSAV